MTGPRQKDDEKNILNDYLKVRGLTGDVRDGPDPPDLLVQIDGVEVGFEITRYHQPHETSSRYNRRKVEAAWEKLRQHERSTRDDRTELKDLSVYLVFSDLRVPSGREVCDFVKEVRSKIVDARSRIGSEFTVLEIDSHDPQILRNYLQSIVVDEAGCDLEWDWNHTVARVGTSNDEMLATIKKKLRADRPSNIDSYRLIVAGMWSRLSECSAPISAEQLNGFDLLNEDLKAGPFDEVSLLCIRKFVWTKADGWADVIGGGDAKRTDTPNPKNRVTAER